MRSSSTRKQNHKGSRQEATVSERRQVVRRHIIGADDNGAYSSTRMEAAAVYIKDSDANQSKHMNDAQTSYSNDSARRITHYSAVEK